LIVSINSSGILTVLDTTSTLALSKIYIQAAQSLTHQAWSEDTYYSATLEITSSGPPAANFPP